MNDEPELPRLDSINPSGVQNPIMLRGAPSIEEQQDVR